MPDRPDQHPLAVAALQARSVAAREPLARASGAASVQELITAAHRGTDLPGVDGWIAGELARTIAGQELRPNDLSDALVLLAHLSRQGQLAHLGLRAQLAYAVGDRPLALQLLAIAASTTNANGSGAGAGAGIAEPIRTALQLDLRNPYAGGSGDGWAEGFARLLPAPAVRVEEGLDQPFDRVGTAAAQRRGHGLRISTIVTTYRPGRSLLTSVRSLVAQTWTNQEILLVDDGSPDEFDRILKAAAALDPRIRLIRMVTNSGTYVARNAGLDVATGDFVTFQDSDDWSHPLRLERQIAPLLADETVFSTTSCGVRVTGDLVLTRPGVTAWSSYNLSSLMFRRQRALSRVGYFDPVRKGADAEYVERARAVFGRPATHHLTGAPLALIRLSADSLSSADYRPGWMHPARRSYLSAFQGWHNQIKIGTAEPLRSSAFVAPRHLRGETGAKAYDVVLAGDFTSAGAAGIAGVGQLRALAERGQRPALLHLDHLSNLRAGPKNLAPAVQDLINAGALTQVELTDDVRARLVVVRGVRSLQHATDLPSGVRAQRVVIESAAVSGSASAAARRLFGRTPLWAPAGPDARRLLAAELDRDDPALTALDLPETLDATLWRLDRRGPRTDRPVVGRYCRGGRAEWHRLRVELPDHPRVDLRLFDSTSSVNRAFGKPGPPRSWLVFGPDDVSLRSFLYQVDFYLHLPAADTPADPDGDVLTALAAGCVVLLPHQYAPTFGDAAIYCTPDQMPETVRRLHGDRAALHAQSTRGPQFVRQHHSHDLYADRVAQLATRG